MSGAARAGGGLCDQAIRLHQAGDLDAAERLYRRALAADPDAFTPRHMLGVIRYQQGRGEEAVRLIADALARDPRSAPAWFNHGNVLASLGRHDAAAASYDRALALKPGDVESLHGRANALLAAGRLDAALADYDRVLAFRPRDVSVLSARGSIFWSQGRYGEARACHEAVLALQPRNVEALNNMGNVLRAEGSFAQALACYDRALAIQPGLAEILCNRGAALSEMARFAEALASLDRAVTLKPELAEAWNNRGDALRALGRHGDALHSFARALALTPDYPAARNNRAKLLCEMGHIEQAFADFRRAAALVHGTQTRAATDRKRAHDRAQQAWRAVQDGSHPMDGAKLRAPVLRAGDWRARALAQWRTASPQVAVIDGFLTGDALTALRRFCWGADIWHRTYEDGYLGAFPETGLACPLLAEIAEQLRDSLPEVFAGHPLRYLWAFKHDAKGRGTHVHADEAAVNVNFWIAPDEANRDPDSGGLVVWDVGAPADWDFVRYNADAAAGHAFLARHGAKPLAIPHRANRAVIFDSRLFHQTDRCDFGPGYRERRINITLLYGRRPG